MFRAEVVINCEGFWKLLKLEDYVSADQLFPEVKEGLFKAFSLTADAFIGDDKQNEYWTRVSRTYFGFDFIIHFLNFIVLVIEIIVVITNII